MNHTAPSIHEWNDIQKLSKEYIRLVNKLLKYPNTHWLNINLQRHFENTQKLAHILGDSVLEEESIRDKVLHSLKDSQKTFTEIKASFMDIDSQTLKDVMMKMEDDGELEFYSHSGLWMIL